ncbi:hypothetical protein [Methylibium sp.]|uniref:hypothetical protein n=1 Tax=Methylibium sp. TaxID=2067992 RepID=UPI001836A4F8|nr:hypothetical protein [Methylibium sp.]MBA3590367.1 hypothetical protein [Methylibium sp.]
MSRVPACLCDACEGGRKACPSPESCVLPENEAVPFFRGPDGIVALGSVAAAVFVVVMEVGCWMPGGCS